MLGLDHLYSETRNGKAINVFSKGSDLNFHKNRLIKKQTNKQTEQKQNNSSIALIQMRSTFGADSVSNNISTKQKAIKKVYLKVPHD